MGITKLVLKNIGVFSQKTIEFKEGLNLIYGENASGKTTIANSIFYCLLGQHLFPKAKPDSLAKYGSSHGTTGLFFQKDGIDYRIYRSTHKKVQLEQCINNQWETILDENFIDNLNRQKIAMISFLREGEISEFLTKDPADRKEVLNTLLGIQDLIDATELFKEARKIAKREEKRLLEYSKSIRVESVDDKKKEIQKLEVHLQELEKQDETLSKNPSLSINLQLLNKLKVDTEQFRGKIKERELEKIRLLSNLENVKGLEDIIKEIDIELVRFEEQRLELPTLMSKKGEIEGKISQFAQNEQRLEEVKDICPTCGQRLTQEQIFTFIQQTQLEKTKLSNELKAINEEITKLSNEEKMANTLKDKRYELKRRLELIKRIDDEIISLEKEYSLAKENLIIEEAKIKNLEAIQKSQAEYKNLKEEMTSVNRRLIELNKESAVIETRLKEVVKLKKELAQAANNRLKFEFAVTSLEKTRDYILKEVFYPAQERLQGIIGEFGFFEGANVDICSNYLLPILSFESQEYGMLNLSGSEKMIIYLGMKVAISEHLGNLGFFIFDDPSLHLDLERKRLLLQFITKLAGRMQVIALTNDKYLLENVNESERIELK
ncbi:MAG: AAA family ATPase [Nitrospirota bacterium]